MKNWVEEKAKKLQCSKQEAAHLMVWDIHQMREKYKDLIEQVKKENGGTMPYTRFVKPWVKKYMGNIVENLK